MTWLLTWTTYDTWLPGDARGFVSGNRESGEREVHNHPDTPYDADRPALKAYARSILREEPVWLSATEADETASQFRETAGFRGWGLLALAVMANHVHLVVECPDDLGADRLLIDFKAYASRRLSRTAGRKRTWWAERGSTRTLRDAAAVAAAVRYVADQHAPLVVWVADAAPLAGLSTIPPIPTNPEGVACHSVPSRWAT